MFQKLLSPEHKMPNRNAKLRWFVTLTTMPLLWLLNTLGLMPRCNPGLIWTKITIEKIAFSKVAASVTARELNFSA